VYALIAEMDTGLQVQRSLGEMVDMHVCMVRWWH